MSERAFIVKGKPGITSVCLSGMGLARCLFLNSEVSGEQPDQVRSLRVRFRVGTAFEPEQPRRWPGRSEQKDARRSRAVVEGRNMDAGSAHGVVRVVKT